MQQLEHIESICHHYFFVRFIVAFLFFSHSGESVYDLLRFKLTLLKSKTNSLPIIDPSNPF